MPQEIPDCFKQLLGETLLQGWISPEPFKIPWAMTQSQEDQYPVEIYYAVIRLYRLLKALQYAYYHDYGSSIPGRKARRSVAIYIHAYLDQYEQNLY